MRKLSVFLILINLICCVVGEEGFVASIEKLTPKFIFLFIGDGMGETHPLLAQHTMQQEDSFAKINFLEFPIQLKTRVHSADKAIPDSAAGATAIACGVKTNNGNIGVDAEGNAVESIVELAKKRNRKVGFISSTNINNHTIAAFTSHYVKPQGFYAFGIDMINADIDFISGGNFLGHTVPNKKRLYDYAEERGYTILRNLKQINELNVAEGDKIIATVPRRMEYNRHPRYGDVAMADLVQFGIDFLMNEEGFLLVVEGGLIEINSHTNQSASVVGEMVEFNNAVNTAFDFVKRFPQNSLIIITADHETGDLQTTDNRNFYWKSYGNSGKNIITYIYGAKQESFVPENGNVIDNTDIAKKLKEIIQE